MSAAAALAMQHGCDGRCQALAMSQVNGNMTLGEIIHEGTGGEDSTPHVQEQLGRSRKVHRRIAVAFIEMAMPSSSEPNREPASAGIFHRVVGVITIDVVAAGVIIIAVGMETPILSAICHMTLYSMDHSYVCSRDAPSRPEQAEIVTRVTRG